MQIEEQAHRLLSALKEHKNVLLLGPPATGKSMLMAEIAKRFIGTTSSIPVIDPGGRIPIPAAAIQTAAAWMPSPSRTNRKTFHITFHQGTKHRDFVSGIVPELRENHSGFRIANGILVEANAFALANGASLILIDELNRGPAVSIFGDTLTAIEADKRLDDNDAVVYTAAPFKAYKEGTGRLEDIYLSPNVYILASMNEADTSVEALDIAFLRRFKPYRLYPSEDVVMQFLGLTSLENTPHNATTPTHIFQALVKAWNKVNEQISWGKGDAFMAGHGILLVDKQAPSTLEEAKAYALHCWQRIEAHVKELFYGNDEAQAIVFNARTGGKYELKEFQFGDQEIEKLYTGRITEENIYELLLGVFA